MRDRCEREGGRAMRWEREERERWEREREKKMRESEIRKRDDRAKERERDERKREWWEGKREMRERQIWERERDREREGEKQRDEKEMRERERETDGPADHRSETGTLLQPAGGGAGGLPPRRWKRPVYLSWIYILLHLFHHLLFAPCIPFIMYSVLPFLRFTIYHSLLRNPIFRAAVDHIRGAKTLNEDK